MIFLRESTQNDHIRLLYKFENDQKKFGCVGGCGYAPASVKWTVIKYTIVISELRQILETNQQKQDLTYKQKKT